MSNKPSSKIALIVDRDSRPSLNLNAPTLADRLMEMATPKHPRRTELTTYARILRDSFASFCGPEPSIEFRLLRARWGRARRFYKEMGGGPLN